MESKEWGSSSPPPRLSTSTIQDSLGKNFLTEVEQAQFRGRQREGRRNVACRIILWGEHWGSWEMCAPRILGSIFVTLERSC